jgi:hypothetical protein
VLDNYKYLPKEKAILHISKGIRNIIVEETSKLEKLEN